MKLDDRLQRAVPPDVEAARDRAWAVIEAAAPRTTTKHATITKFVVVGVAGAAATAALAVSGGGATAAEWVSDRFEAAPAPRVAVQLPTHGRLLVDGPIVIRQDGSRVELPAADGATWSPNGLFVAAWHDKELRALEPDGDPRWRIEATAPVRTASWSPDGLRIAYLAGGRIHIVSGNGTNDHALPGGQARPVRPAWNPVRPQELAYVTRRGNVVVRDVATGVAVRRLESGRRATSLSFSEKGRLKATRAAAAYAPQGDRLATVHGGTLRIDGKAIVTVRGELGPPVWSPDGRFVAVSRGRGVLVASVSGSRLTTLPGGELYGWAPPRG